MDARLREALADANILVTWSPNDTEPGGEFVVTIEAAAYDVEGRGASPSLAMEQAERALGDRLWGDAARRSFRSPAPRRR